MTPSTATDPRVERSREAIREAAIAELADVGYGAMTIESIARRAGVGKATVYRHWRGKLDLVASALDALKQDIQPPAGGTVHERVIALLESLAAFLADSDLSACLPALVSAAQYDDSVRAFQHRFTQERRQVLVDLLAEGRESGELDPDLDARLAADALVGPLFFARLMAQDAFPPERVGRLVALVLFQRALVTFALARTLNGLISAAQGTEIALQPAGVGVTLTPGEILDPVNDLIERFSWVMLAATVSLGVQQVLLDIGQWWGARLLVGLSGLLWLWAMIARGTASHQFPAKIEPILMRAFLILIFLRFAVPFALIANETLFEMFMQPKFDESTAVITSAGADIQSASAREQDPITDESFLGTIERMVDSTKESLNLRQRVEYIQQRASDVVEHLIQLAVVFILQSAVLPLVFLWLLINLLKMLIQRQMWRPRHDSNV